MPDRCELALMAAHRVAEELWLIERQHGDQRVELVRHAGALVGRLDLAIRQHLAELGIRVEEGLVVLAVIMPLELQIAAAPGDAAGQADGPEGRL